MTSDMDHKTTCNSTSLQLGDCWGSICGSRGLGTNDYAKLYYSLNMIRLMGRLHPVTSFMC